MAAIYNGNYGLPGEGFTVPAATAMVVFLLLQVILYCIFTDYNTEYDSTSFDENFELKYPWFQDVHIMIFVGFGFLMCYLKFHGYSSVGFNYLVGCASMLWAILCNGFFEQAFNSVSNGSSALNSVYELTKDATNKVLTYTNGGDTVTINTATSWDESTMGQLYLNNHEEHSWHSIKLTIDSIIVGDFTAAACLISFGAILGKVNPTQLVVMVFLECIFFAINERIGVQQLQVVDMGGSIFVHLFGALFGVAVSRVLSTNDQKNQAERRQVGSKYSDLFAMVGTIFLFCFWPSFNGALASGEARHRCVINTVIALCGSVIATYVVSVIGNKNRFLMEHIQNASLAGGVAIGSSADLIVKPWGALIMGIVAGTISTLGFAFGKPFLEKRCGLHDACGVLHLHGIPGFLGALGGSIASVAATAITPLCSVYPATATSWDQIKESGSGTGAMLIDVVLTDGCAPGNGRSAGEQAGYQFAATLITCVIAIATGALTGAIMQLKIFNPVREAFTDEAFWDVEEEDRGDFWSDDEEVAVHAVAAGGNRTAQMQMQKKDHNVAL